MRKFSRVAVVFAASVALVGLNQGSASALEAHCWTADSDDGGKSCQIWHEANGAHVDSVRFNSYGETLWVYDLVSDGKGVTAFVNGREYPGRPSDYGPVEYNLSIAEGTKVELTSCQTDNGRVYDCHTEWAIA
ncbi:hypothetical protein [Streptomyces sp. NPDC051561]|uniref:hypothetical protein n=1 Tax=Streptomyces sp. NPDC051561 TaxID=3365658 RepID=UPI0037ADA19F